jgi:hypothetical protein
LHFQAYRLAYDLAKRAERAWRFELAGSDASFVQFGYWDSLKKGLLAGERLAHDLRRMDAAYLDANKRDFELVRHVSLRELDPVALLDLKQKASCEFDVPEEWFDLVTPGHFLRRIKTVSLSLPSVTGPYVSVPCKLTLTRNEVRPSKAPGAALEKYEFATGSIVTSHAQEDSGLFETSLRDERYLPFEGAGVISGWRLELPEELRPFDYSTISDAILHIRYTAREGGDELRADAVARVKQKLSTGLGLVFISARADFSDAWASFLAPPANQTDQSLRLPLDKRLLPHFAQGLPVAVEGVALFLAPQGVEVDSNDAPVKLTLRAPDTTTTTLALSVAASEPPGALPHAQVSFGGGGKELGDWSLVFPESLNPANASPLTTSVDGHSRLNPGAVRDLLLVVRYRID